MVLALLQSVTGGNSTTDKPIEDVFDEPITVICTKSDVPSTYSPARHPTSDSVVIIPDYKTCEENHIHDTGFDDMEKMNNGETQANIGTSIISEIKGSSTISGQVDQRLVTNLLLQADEPKSRMKENPSPMNHCNGGIDTGVVNEVVEIEDGLYTKVEHIIEYKDSSALGANLKSAGISPSQKLELRTLNCVATRAATSRVLVSKSNGNENKSQVNEMMLLCNKNISVMHSPCNSRIHMTRNAGNDKSLSNGHSNVCLSKEENDCHLSVESCHNTCFLSIGKKRCNFQQVIIGSKKVKTQIQETPCSKSDVKPDSSFMNLISNIMKGCSQSTQDEDKSLALAPENPDHCLQWPDQKLLTRNNNKEPELTNAGFRSNSLAMCCPRLNNVRTRMCHQVGEAFKDFELGNKGHGIDATPIYFLAENNSLYRQYLHSNKLEVSKGRNGACPPLHPQTTPIHFINSHEHWKNNSVENENCYKLGHSKGKERMTSLSLHSPSTRQNKNENVESYALCEGKEICHKSDTLGGLWINRFSPKSTSPLLLFDHPNERGGSEVHSTSYSMLPHYHKHIALNNCKTEDAKEQSADEQLLSEAIKLSNYCISKEASTSLKDNKGDHNHTSKHNFNSITPLPVLGDSGPMVCMFARRVGAIKQCQLTE
ncbi:uncharacterized protein LOC113872813 isoform X2 [Abrus precatorius]|nr:uncharacterized protein LOC113872813 isoform X2 [Abrus precatorius]